MVDCVQLCLLHHKAYCRDKNIPYNTFRHWKKEYDNSLDKENWSFNSKRRLRHRTFTDSTEKAAVNRWRETYYDKH